MTEKPLWKQQADINTASRLPWRKLLGETLTARITNLKKAGATEQGIYEEIKDNCPGLTELALKRLKISISSRLAEQNAAQNRLEE
jgi:hypothetical protein